MVLTEPQWKRLWSNPKTKSMKRLECGRSRAEARNKAGGMKGEERKRMNVSIAASSCQGIPSGSAGNHPRSAWVAFPAAQNRRRGASC